MSRPVLSLLILLALSVLKQDVVMYGLRMELAWQYMSMTLLGRDCDMLWLSDPKLLLRSTQGWCWKRNRSSSKRMLRHEGCPGAPGFLWPLATIFTEHLLWSLNLPTATKSHLPYLYVQILLTFPDSPLHLCLSGQHELFLSNLKCYLFLKLCLNL